MIYRDLDGWCFLDSRFSKIERRPQQETWLNKRISFNAWKRETQAFTTVLVEILTLTLILSLTSMNIDICRKHASCWLNVGKYHHRCLSQCQSNMFKHSLSELSDWRKSHALSLIPDLHSPTSRKRDDWTIEEREKKKSFSSLTGVI